MNEVTPYRVLDVGAAKLALRSPIERLHADLDRVYPHLPETTDSGFADVRVALLPGSPLRLRGRQVSLWSEGERPFGDQGIRAYFNDAVELGTALSLVNVSDSFKGVADDIGVIMAQCPSSEHLAQLVA